MRIVDLRSDDEPVIKQAATLLLEGFAEHHAGAWPDLESALEEVRGSVGEDRISRVALDENGMVVGWIAGVSLYDGMGASGNYIRWLSTCGIKGRVLAVRSSQNLNSSSGRGVV